VPPKPPLPKYVQVSERLIREIAAGHLADGTRLPNERTMAQDLDLSVGTLRKALALLTEQGLLVRVQGSGNYIRQRPDVQSVYSFFRLERPNGGGLPTATVLDVTLCPKPKDAPAFGAEAQGWRIRRLRRSDDVPIAVEEIWLDAARAHDEDDPGPVEGMGPGGYARVHTPLLTLIADAAPPATGPWSGTACAQTGAMEIICGRDRIVTNCGWTPRAHERQAMRLTPAGSTLCLGDGAMAQPLTGWKADLLGTRLVGPTIHVDAQHRAAEGAVWLEIEHDGWAPRFGLKHQRRLYLDQRLDELRAEERLYPCDGHKDAARPLAAPYAVRFHLEPGVQASLARDKRSILLRGASGRGWWFRSDAPDVDIEPSVHVADGLTRRSLQLVLRGSARTDAETRIRWKMSPAGASGETG